MMRQSRVHSNNASTSSSTVNSTQNVPKLPQPGKGEPATSPMKSPQKKAKGVQMVVETPFPVPFLLSEKWKERCELILEWVRTEIQEYNCSSILGTHSLGSGEHFVALTHKFFPQLIDYEHFDNASPEVTLEHCINILVNPPIQLPPLLSPKAVVQNSDPTSLLLYLTLFQRRVQKLRSSPSSHTIGTIQKISSNITHCFDDLDRVATNWGEDVTALLASVQRETILEEKLFLEQRGKIMDGMLKEATNEVENMEAKNRALEEENDKLLHKVQEMENLIRKEENLRKRVEEEMRLLSSQGKSVEDYVKMYSK